MEELVYLLKIQASATWWTTKALEDCRRVLGGHGYSLYSGVPKLIRYDIHSFSSNCPVISVFTLPAEVTILSSYNKRATTSSRACAPSETAKRFVLTSVFPLTLEIPLENSIAYLNLESPLMREEPSTFNILSTESVLSVDMLSSLLKYVC